MGKRKINIYDVANKLGVSISTVSRALNDNPKISPATTKKVKRMAEKLGFQKNPLASGLMTNKTKTIGVLVPQINKEFVAQAVRSIEDTAFDMGYSVMICQSHESYSREQESINTLLSSRVDGIIVSLALETKNLEHFHNAIDSDTPVVFFDRVPSDLPNTTKIIVDNFESAYKATNHLIDQGFKRIGHIGGPQSRKVFEDRFEGYKKALADNKIALDDTITEGTDLSQEDCFRAAKKILHATNPPDAIVCANHLASVNTIFYALSINKSIPQDVAVVGFSENPIAEIMIPSLTAVRQPCAEMGKIATQKLIEEINFDHKNDQYVHSTIVLDTKLEIRGSSVLNVRETMGKL